MSIVPSVCASTPCQSDGQRSERSRQDENSDVVHSKQDILHDVMATKQWLWREIGRSDGYACQSVDASIEVIGPPPTASSSSILPNKSCRKKCAEDDESAGHGLRDAYGPWAESIRHDFLNAGDGDDLSRRSAVTWLELTRMMELTQPAFASPVKMLPPMTVVILCAEAEITDPTTPIKAPPTRNHFFPRRSPREPKIGPIARTTRKLPLAIHDAKAASWGDFARVAT